MNVSITIHHHGSSHHYTAIKDTPVAHVLREQGFLAQPCGTGQCGKCHIKANTSPTDFEKLKLNPQQLNDGIRLACYTMSTEGLEVSIIEQSALVVLTEFTSQKYEFSPLMECLDIQIPVPTLEDQRDDIIRLLQVSDCSSHAMSLKEIANISQIIHQTEHMRILRHNGCLFGINPYQHHLAIAVDIGTTTLAATLIDLENNTILASCGEANTQSSWGADVISRIQQTIPESTPEYEKNINLLQHSVVQQINALRIKMLQEAGFDPKTQDVQYITLAGNTTMMHMLTALPAKNISRAPFIPVTTQSMILNAQEIGMPTNAILFLMPSIAAYIGADIVAALLAVNAHKKQKPFLLLDLGTNAEIVLGFNDTFMACSAAAGPCFEGACLACGMAGQAGAINHVYLNEKGEMTFDTIQNIPAKGICGSGVLDALALFLETDVMDETGLIEADNSPLKHYVKEDENGKACFYFTDTVFISQKDIREIQLAKAAVRAGIHALLDKAQIPLENIENLYIAGGFGSAMTPESAAAIGLIPHELLPHTKAVGNAASLGVIRYATEKNVLEHVKHIVQNTDYVELSALPSFTNMYVEQMVFMKN